MSQREIMMFHFVLVVGRPLHMGWSSFLVPEGSNHGLLAEVIGGVGVRLVFQCSDRNAGGHGLAVEKFPNLEGLALAAESE
jgi:hypothetical protein